MLQSPSPAPAFPLAPHEARQDTFMGFSKPSEAAKLQTPLCSLLYEGDVKALPARAAHRAAEPRSLVAGGHKSAGSPAL